MLIDWAFWAKICQNARFTDNSIFWQYEKKRMGEHGFAYTMGTRRFRHFSPKTAVNQQIEDQTKSTNHQSFSHLTFDIAKIVSLNP
jgi:hypothetical protein